MKIKPKPNHWHRVRCAIQILSICVLPFATTSQLGAKRQKHGLPLHVLVFNYSGASPTALAVAEGQADRIFSRAGIDIAWLHCPIPLRADSDEACATDVGVAGEVRVRIMDQATENAYRDTVFGFTIPPVFATVYYGHLLRIPTLHNPDYETPLILGCLIAHEIGHLLLGPGAHATSGIMQAKLQLDDLTRAIRGQLVFTRAEANLLRANVLLRDQRFMSRQELRKQMAQVE